jgi:hypothetical protein
MELKCVECETESQSHTVENASRRKIDKVFVEDCCCNLFVVGYSLYHCDNKFDY